MAAQARKHLCNRLLAIDDLARAHLLEPDGDLVPGGSLCSEVKRGSMCLHILGGRAGQLRVS